jgi:membrane-associated protein
MDSLLLALAHRHLHGPSVDYAGVGLAAVGGWAGVPGVGEAALVAGGILAARGRLSLPEVVAVAWLGATVGGIAGWLIGLKVGHAVFAGPGPFRATRMRMLAAGERLYERHGALAVFFTPAWLAGIHRMHSRAYLVLNAISALLWAITVGVGAYLIGPSIADVVSDVGLAGVVLVVVVASGGWIATRVRRARSRRRT